MNQPKVETKSVQTIVFESNSWDLSPDYQRNAVFQLKDKCYLIESILDSFPIGGSIFLVPTPNDDVYNYEVLDGKQRITTLREFLNSEFKFKPRNATKWSHLSGKCYNQFPKAARRDIDSYQFPIVILDPEMSDEANIKSMFERINSTGVKLNKSEMRHSWGMPVGTMLKTVVESFNNGTKDKLSRVILKSASSIRMNDEGDLAKLLSRYFYTIKQGDMTMQGEKYPTSFYKSEFTEQELHDMESRTLKVLRGLEKLLSSPFGSIAEMDGVFSVLYHNDVSWHKLNSSKDDFQDALSQIKQCYKDNEVVLMGGGSSHGALAVLKRYNIAYEHLQKFIIQKDTQRAFSYQQRNEAWETRPHVCAICGKKLDFFEQMDLDHIIAYNNGGSTTLDNAQITCIHCNRSKQDK